METINAKTSLLTEQGYLLNSLDSKISGHIKYDYNFSLSGKKISWELNPDDSQLSFFIPAQDRMTVFMGLYYFPVCMDKNFDLVCLNVNDNTNIIENGGTFAVNCNDSTAVLLRELAENRILNGERLNILIYNIIGLSGLINDSGFDYLSGSKGAELYLKYILQHLRDDYSGQVRSKNIKAILSALNEPLKILPDVKTGFILIKALELLYMYAYMKNGMIIIKEETIKNKEKSFGEFFEVYAEENVPAAEPVQNTVIESISVPVPEPVQVPVTETITVSESEPEPVLEIENTQEPELSEKDQPQLFDEMIAEESRNSSIIAEADNNSVRVTVDLPVAEIPAEEQTSEPKPAADIPVTNIFYPVFESQLGKYETLNSSNQFRNILKTDQAFCQVIISRMDEWLTLINKKSAESGESFDFQKLCEDVKNNADSAFADLSSDKNPVDIQPAQTSSVPEKTEEMPKSVPAQPRTAVYSDGIKTEFYTSEYSSQSFRFFKLSYDSIMSNGADYTLEPVDNPNIVKKKSSQFVMYNNQIILNPYMFAGGNVTVNQVRDAILRNIFDLVGYDDENAVLKSIEGAEITPDFKVAKKGVIYFK